MKRRPEKPLLDVEPRRIAVVERWDGTTWVLAGWASTTDLAEHLVQDFVAEDLGESWRRLDTTRRGEAAALYRVVTVRAETRVNASGSYRGR